MMADRRSLGSPLHSDSQGQKESWADSQNRARAPSESPKETTTAGRERHRAKLCLKARPTAVQLADRLRAVDGVWPDGVELYLAAADLTSGEMVETIAQRVLEQEVPNDFAWLIEGPVDSLDGGDFDVTRESAADALVLERLAHLA